MKLIVGRLYKCADGKVRLCARPGCSWGYILHPYGASYDWSSYHESGLHQPDPYEEPIADGTEVIREVVP